MKLTNFFENLSYGELSNLSMSADGSGTIVENKQPMVVRFLNEALTALHSSFNLCEKDLLIEMVEGVTHYHLNKQHTLSNFDPDKGYIPYIIDNADPYKDDLIKILRVYIGQGVALPLNDEENPRSVFTPQIGVLQVSMVLPGQPLCVVYQANHEKITGDDLEQEINLPVILHEVLNLYVASKIFSTMATQENLAKSQELMAQYTARVKEILSDDAVSMSVSTTNTRFERGGWV